LNPSKTTFPSWQLEVNCHKSANSGYQQSQPQTDSGVFAGAGGVTDNPHRLPQQHYWDSHPNYSKQPRNGTVYASA
jgi:hypothetical protein